MESIDPVISTHNIEDYPVILRVETTNTLDGDTITLLQLGDKIISWRHPLSYKMVASGIEMLTNYYTKSQDRHHELLLSIGEHLIEPK